MIRIPTRTHSMAAISTLAALAGMIVGSSCAKDTGEDCQPGEHECECVQGACLDGLTCVDDVCLDSDGTDAGGPAAVEGQWETVVDRAIFVHNSSEDVAWALGVTQITELSIGKVGGDNLINRGHVEVIYAEDHVGEIVDDFENPPVISVEIRKFTTANYQANAEEAMARLNLYAYTTPPGNAAPTSSMQSDWCVRETSNPIDPEAPLSVWQEGCHLTVWYDGINQPLRDGADIRVTVPADWRGSLDIVTSDNDADQAEYPRRSDVTLLDILGDASITLESGEANVRASPNYLEVRDCDAQGHQNCRDARWNPNYTACIGVSADDNDMCGGVGDCEGEPLCMVNHCYCNQDEFLALDIDTADFESANITIDLPAHLWTLARVENTDAALTPDSDPLCSATIECADFDGCEIDQDNSADVWKMWAELNDLGPDNIEGLGVQLSAQSRGCADVPVARSPDDHDQPTNETRGNVTVCSGCLDGL